MSEPFKAVPLTQLRQIIAARMTDAKQTIPHYRVSMDIEMDAVLALRQQINQQDPDNKVSVNDFIIKACATALMQNPEINVQWVENTIHQYAQTDISVVIAVPGGLSTPVIREANRKTVQQISREMKSLAERAGKNQLKRSEIAGGTFSISNLGMYGVDHFDAIINPPQCAILAVGAAKPQPVVKNGAVQIATRMSATLSLDHRAIDGTTGAIFLSAVRQCLEQPEGLRAGEVA